MGVQKKKQWEIVLMGMIFVMIIVALSNNQSDKTITRTDFLLDTFVSVTLYGESDESLFEKPFERIKELEKQLSAYDATSDLGLIKENAGIQAVAVSEDTFKIIAESLNYSHLSQGKFDVTINPLVDLWEIHSPEVRNPPAEEAIAGAIAKIDFEKVELDEDQKTVYLTEPGMSLNLGAIAKGYIADEMMSILKDQGVKHALLNLGGNVLVLGGKDNKTPFGIGVEDPLNPGQGYLGVVSMVTGSVVTSGNYERYFTDAEGHRYHHILDPDTGYPAETGINQVTVLTGESIDADALSTTLFLLGEKKGMALVKRLDQVEAIFVTKTNDIVLSEGAKELFTFDEERYGILYTLKE